jgi:hypothetical protein
VPPSRLRGPLPTSLTLTLADRLSVERQDRLLRQQSGKTSVRIIDWLDLSHPVPQRLWERRSKQSTSPASLGWTSAPSPQ